MSILIVDDEERDRTWLKNLLSNNLAQEMSITEGKDGTQAVELASKLKPKLVCPPMVPLVMSSKALVTSK
ncbi:MAG: hypothetical protein IPJ49_18270 [Candidatus Obscuribacter sp.]|nr:hypothetical protein [Candidatus Obscuribacter sp.]